MGVGEGERTFLTHMLGAPIAAKKGTSLVLQERGIIVSFTKQMVLAVWDPWGPQTSLWDLFDVNKAKWALIKNVRYKQAPLSYFGDPPVEIRTDAYALTVKFLFAHCVWFIWFDLSDT